MGANENTNSPPPSSLPNFLSSPIEGSLPSTISPPAPDAPSEPLVAAHAEARPAADQLVTSAAALLTAALTNATTLPNATLPLPIQRNRLDDMMEIILDRLDGQEIRTNERLEAIAAAQEASHNQMSKLQRRRGERRNDSSPAGENENPPPPQPSVEDRYDNHRRRPASIIVGSVDRRSREEPNDEQQDGQGQRSGSPPTPTLSIRLSEGDLKDETIRRLEEMVHELSSRVHRATSSAPNLDRVLEEVQRSPFTSRISRVQVRYVNKFKFTPYNGLDDPKPF